MVKINYEPITRRWNFAEVMVLAGGPSLLQIIKGLNEEEKKLAYCSLFSDARRGGGLVGLTYCEDTIAAILDEEDYLHQKRLSGNQEILSELQKLDGEPIYDLGCGIKTNPGKLFRTYMPNSPLIGIDIDPLNLEIRKKIVEDWGWIEEYLQDRDKLFAHRDKLFAHLEELERSDEKFLRMYSDILSYFLDPENPDRPRYKESFHLNEYKVGDFNHLELPDDSVALIYSNLVGEIDIQRVTEGGFLTPFSFRNEITRVLKKGGMWISSEDCDYSALFEIAYKKIKSNEDIFR